MGSFLMEFTSWIDGESAQVAIGDDRIEWSGSGVKIGTSFTDGTTVLPFRWVHGVSLHPRGFGRTALRVAASGDTVEFRLPSHQAAEVRDLLLILDSRIAGASRPPEIPEQFSKVALRAF